ncbi:arginine and glutamate-rich protein 1-like [Dendronephthya gigantea]|uniref:arginine and glutamate-rich protein 1-like n=1 Tax=Dendronephthya gigantea TaxID=151771 RepID=UPI00106CFE15|nr:arginine and glutamate-rich protein 1-like [Dendronephthya gigantea]
MNLQEFPSDSASKTGGKIQTNTTQPQNFNTKVNKTRPSSGIRTNTNTKSEDGKSMPTGKLLLEKQMEERKRKNAERKAAVEDRRRQKEKEDMTKNAALRQLLEHKAPTSKTSSRKLPTVPHNGAAAGRRETSATRRLSSSSSSSEGHTPPGSGKGGRSTRRNLTGPSSASTSSLNSFGGPQHLGRPQTNLGASKRTSSSTNNLNDGGKTGQRAKDTGAGVTARRSVGANIPKAQSMGAIHQVGGHTKPSRPPTGKKTKAKPKPTHHAGTSNEAEAGRALAEHRKKMREEAERKALLDKEKQEELRKQREEEEMRLAEEKAKEMARQAELLAELQKQEEERSRLLREDRERDAALEAEKLAAEVKRKEELEVLRRRELERRAAEAERREKEEEERLRREEIERQERRKRVEMIMNRTRMTSTVNNNMTKAESYSSLEDLSVKLSDECHSSTVSEILQKMKEKTRVSPSPEKDLEQQKENQEICGNSQKDSVDGKNESSAHVFRAIDNSQTTELTATNEI